MGMFVNGRGFSSYFPSVRIIVRPNSGMQPHVGPRADKCERGVPFVKMLAQMDIKAVPRLLHVPFTVQYNGT